MSHYTMLSKYGFVLACSKLKTSLKSVVFTNKVAKNSRYFVGVFNNTIIPLALVGYEMIIANSYPTRTRGILVKYTHWILMSTWRKNKTLLFHCDVTWRKRNNTQNVKGTLRSNLMSTLVCSKQLKYLCQCTSGRSVNVSSWLFLKIWYCECWKTTKRAVYDETPYCLIFGQYIAK